MTNTNSKAPRITKSQRFEDIKALLMGETPVYGTTPEKAVEVLNHELELLAKKNTTGTKSQTANQKMNETYLVLIENYLSIHPEGATCTQILKGVPELADYQVQKVSALVRSLVNAGKVTSEMVKGKRVFSLC